MDEEMKLIIGMTGMLIASGLLTWLTQPSQFAPLPSKRKRKYKTKLRLQDRQPFLNDDGRLAMNPHQDLPATGTSDRPQPSLTHYV